MLTLELLRRLAHYNRASVERVMGFSTRKEYDEFKETVGNFEMILVRSGVKLLKYYLDIP